MLKELKIPFIDANTDKVTINNNLSTSFEKVKKNTVIVQLKHQINYRL